MNVWLALATNRHVHHVAATAWFESLPEEGAVFCRVTQMGFLRLLTNRAVMGDDVLSPANAWARYAPLRRDWRIGFAPEPSGFEESWIGLMTQAAGASWTDGYLAAFALGHGYSLASFDAGFRRWKELRFHLLRPACAP